jgi:hypothetical protein
VLETGRGCQFTINWIQKLHLYGPAVLIYHEARSTKH